MNIYAERERTRCPSLPSELWRERFLAGWPEAWDSPQAPLQILCWESREGDFRGPEDGAIDAALALASDPYRSGPEGISRIREELARWWASESNARAMLRYLGRRAFAAGEGTPDHRMVTLLACLCARTAPRMPAQSLRAIDMIEAWAWGWGEDLRKEAHQIAYGEAAETTSAAAAAAAATDVASVASYVVATDAADAASSTAYAAATDVVAVAASDAEGEDWNTAMRRHIAALADLVRAAVPTAHF